MKFTYPGPEQRIIGHFKEARVMAQQMINLNIIAVGDLGQVGGKQPPAARAALLF
jgi:hypothetical protein